MAALRKTHDKRHKNVFFFNVLGNCDSQMPDFTAEASLSAILMGATDFDWRMFPFRASPCKRREKGQVCALWGLTRGFATLAGG